MISLALMTHGDALMKTTLSVAFPGAFTSAFNCGCIHSEMNALVKAPGNATDKVVFISASPCVMCAKLIINSGVTHVFYRKAYRDPSGIEVLQQGGVVPVLYDKWVRDWR